MLEKVRTAYEQYRKDVIAVSYHYTGNLAEAEDITQEVFIRFAQTDNTVPQAAVKSWLIRVAINLCLDHKRKLKRIFKMLRVYKHEPRPSNSPITLSKDAGQLLAGLNAKTRLILTLKYMEDMGYEEISNLLQIPVGTLKSIISRAIARFQAARGRENDGR